MKGIRTKGDLATRFWAKVQKTASCWLWTGAQVPLGYGYIGEGGYKVHRAHRLSYEWRFGPLPSGAVICHRCDNPACVNPDHLFRGSQKDNMQDAKSKGRTTQGAKHGRARLTEELVQQIRTARQDGVTHREIAARFGISQGHTTNILNGKVWAHARAS